MATYTPDNLIADVQFPIMTETVTILTGQVLTRGSLLGKVTASGKHILSVAAAVDGSETPVRILAEDVDATAGDVVAIVYKSGSFNANSMTIGTGHTAASVKDGLWAQNIEVRSDAITA